MDIGTEELSHLEVVGALIRMHLKPMKFDRAAAEADPQGAISVWGFAAANTGAESAPRVIGIEFTEWDTGLEFLLGMGRGLPSLSAF